MVTIQATAAANPLTNPDIRSISSNLILPAGARYLQYITAASASLQVTVNSGQSCRVVNRGTNTFTVNLPVNKSETV